MRPEFNWAKLLYYIEVVFTPFQYYGEAPTLGRSRYIRQYVGVDTGHIEHILRVLQVRTSGRFVIN